MSNHRKSKKIFKPGRLVSSGSAEEAQVDTDMLGCPEEKNESPEAPHVYNDEAPLKKSLKMDPRQISNLPQEDREKIRTEHPEMNEYFLMSGRDKSKFFHTLNQKYRKDIKLPQPPGSAPMKKSINFKKRFEIKCFRQEETSEGVIKRRSFMELYKAKQGKKPKALKRARKS